MKTIAIIASALLVPFAGLADASQKVKPYPKDICIVTDNKLGSMGRIITITHGDQEVKFCCRPCVKKFNQNPERYLKKIR